MGLIVKILFVSSVLTVEIPIIIWQLANVDLGYGLNVIGVTVETLKLR